MDNFTFTQLKGSKELEHYILMYSGVPQEKGAAAGVAVMINQKVKNRICSYDFVSEIIVTIRLRIGRGYVSIVGTYSPEEGRAKDTQKFYETLQDTLQNTNKNYFLRVAGDMNDRVANKLINFGLGTNGENAINQNGRKLAEFSIENHRQILQTERHS
jgi:hypothetical protein